ncbi:MAG: glycosyltransferase [Desulfobacteraceae bacterium]|nr:glycosyltransferase [Desulfobacteraceae bacterium]
MKIMQVNVVYPDGSTGNIVKDIHEQLQINGHNSLICYGRGLRHKQEQVFKLAPEFIMKAQSLRAKVTGYAYGGCYYTTRNLIKILEREHPDVVHIHCINGYMVNIYKLLNYLKENNFSTIITLHAEFMYTAGCGHALNCEKWKTGCGECPQRKNGRPASMVFDRSANEWKLMENSFENFNKLVITSVSEWLHNRAKQSPFFKDKKMKIVMNGIDTLDIYNPKEFKELKEKLGLKNEKIVLHVTANFDDPLKGGKYVLKIAERLKNKNVKILIVGSNNGKYKLPSNVLILPKTKDRLELAKLYSMADITLLTSLRETFSMICAESLSCGTPVVGFKAGAPEKIALKKYSKFVEHGNINMLKDAINEYIELKSKNSIQIAKEASIKYSKKEMFKKYYTIYRELLA